MNDVNVAAEKKYEESTEARDFVELGEVSKDTKGVGSKFFDGAGIWG